MADFNLLGAGAGGAGGLEVLLARLRAEEDQKQAAKRTGIAQQEADQRLQIAQMNNDRMREQNQLMGLNRLDALKANEGVKNEDQARKNYDLLGPGRDVSAGTRNQMVGAGISPEQFTTPPETATVPSSIALSGVEEQAPIAGTVPNAPAPSMIPFKAVGTPEQILAQNKANQGPTVKEPTPKSLQSKAFLLNNKIVMGAFDPESGGYSFAGKDVTGQAEGIREGTGQQPEHTTQLVPEVDPGTGRQTGNYFAYDPKARKFLPVSGTAPTGTKAPPGAAQDAQKTSDRTAAVTTLGRLDGDIDAADKIGALGPIGGRLADLDQHIGDPNPAVSTLATRMLLAKMKVDAAIGGLRAAASPQILARWDNLLAAKLTKENLHAVVQVMREMMGDAGTSKSGSGGGLRILSVTKD
jgi:hypothetical protein